MGPAVPQRSVHVVHAARAARPCHGASDLGDGFRLASYRVDHERVDGIRRRNEPEFVAMAKQQQDNALEPATGATPCNVSSPGMWQSRTIVGVTCPVLCISFVQRESTCHLLQLILQPLMLFF